MRETGRRANGQTGKRANRAEGGGVRVLLLLDHGSWVGESPLEIAMDIVDCQPRSISSWWMHPSIWEKRLPIRWASWVLICLLISNHFWLNFIGKLFGFSAIWFRVSTGKLLRAFNKKSISKSIVEFSQRQRINDRATPRRIRKR